MFFLGISFREQWIRVHVSVALQLCLLMESHYVFTAFTQPAYEIIDCEELIQYQHENRISGRLIENDTILNQKTERDILGTHLYNS